MNKSSEVIEKKSGRPDFAFWAAASGLYGAVFGGLFTSAFDLDLVWQATGAMLGALLLSSLIGCLAVVSKVKGAPNEESRVKRWLRQVVVLTFFLAIIGAVVGGLLGALLPSGGVFLSLQLAAEASAYVVATTLIGSLLGLLFAKLTPARLGVPLMGALIGCVLGSQLWRAWFEVGPFNLGIPVIGIPMAFAFFIMHGTDAKQSHGG